jgi:hypothetical protein
MVPFSDSAMHMPSAGSTNWPVYTMYFGWRCLIGVQSPTVDYNIGTLRGLNVAFVDKMGADHPVRQLDIARRGVIGLANPVQEHAEIDGYGDLWFGLDRSLS